MNANPRDSPVGLVFNRTMSTGPNCPKNSLQRVSVKVRSRVRIGLKGQGHGQGEGQEQGHGQGEG